MEDRNKTINEINEKLDKLKIPCDEILKSSSGVSLSDIQNLISIGKEILNLESNIFYDFNILKEDVKVIKNDLDELNDDFSSKLEKETEISRDKFESNREKIQELRGEINQLRFHIKFIKTRMSEGDNKRSTIMTNLVFPFIVAIATGIVLFFCGVLYKASVNDYHFEQQSEQMDLLNRQK